MKRMLLALWLAFLASWVPTAEAQVGQDQMSAMAIKSLDLAVEEFNMEASKIYKVWSIKLANETTVLRKTYVDLLFELKETYCHPNYIHKPDFELNACGLKIFGRWYRCQACFTYENLDYTPNKENWICISKRRESRNPPKHPYCVIPVIIEAYPYWNIGSGSLSSVIYIDIGTAPPPVTIQEKKND